MWFGNYLDERMPCSLVGTYIACNISNIQPNRMRSVDNLYHYILVNWPIGAVIYNSEKINRALKNCIIVN